MIALWLALLAATPSAPACVQTAIDHHRAEEHLLAARAAEACWTSTRSLRALLIGCQARVSLGHFARAASTLAVYDLHATADSSPWSRESAEALRTTIAANTGSLRIVLEQPLTLGERLEFELRPLDSTGDPILGGANDLELAAAAGLRLDGGRWSLVVHRPHFEPTRGEVMVDLRSARIVTVSMRRLATPRAIQLTASPTRLQLGPPRALRRGIELHLRLVDTDMQIVRHEHHEELTLHLPPGKWQVIARARGYAPLRTILRSGTPTPLRLQRKPR